MKDKTNINKPDPQIVEQLHDQGKMPDWAYYQLNGKSAQENFNDWHDKRIQEIIDSEDDSVDVNITSEVKVK